MYKILVADDNKDLLETIMKTLTDESFKVFLAPNGKIACEIALLKSPDLIIMDWVMPQMNGIDAVVQLKGNQETKHIPIIMLTSQSKPEDLKLAMEYGVTDYVKKPFSSIELIARIKTNIKLIESYKEIANLKVKSLEDENELEKMHNRELTNQVKSKAKTLQATALNLSQKNELLDKVMKQLTNALKGESVSFLKLENLLRDLNHTKESDTSLKNFSE
jgi:DNA-binding response OmpR family regulator